MQWLRTPDKAFTAIIDFPYEPHYVTLAGGGRMAYVEAGPSDGEVVVLLHGEPTWSYLYRSVIPVLAEAGLRVLAPDLIGFGRSDKPADVADHTYAGHVEWVRELLFEALDLHAVTIVGHDWGGLIGLRVATENADRVSRIVATNTGLPTGDQAMPEVWLRFRDAVRLAERLDIARFVASGCLTRPPTTALAAYDAPFPDESFKAGPRIMPNLIPTVPDDPASPANRIAWQRLSTWDKPFLVAFTDKDPITGAMAPILARTVPGARSVTIPDGGHFVQEDAGPVLAGHVVEFIAETPGWAPPGVAVDQPSAARIYDYLLGGTHNFPADREVARQAVAAMPEVATFARVNRAFMNRAVRCIVDSGVHQFLDLGSGIPGIANLHEVAGPGAHVVYVDIDPVAVTHARHLLAGNADVVAVQADLRRPLDIVTDPRVRAVLNFDQPVAVIMVAVLHAIGDADDPYAMVAQLRDALAPGSYLVIAHGVRQPRPEAERLVEISRQTTTPMTLRTADEIARFFDGFDLLEPGLVWAPLWRSARAGSDGDETDAPELSGNLAGVGRRP